MLDLIQNLILITENQLSGASLHSQTIQPNLYANISHVGLEFLIVCVIGIVLENNWSAEPIVEVEKFETFNN